LAGEIRKVDISKNETRFCNVNRIKPEVIKLLACLKNENNLLDYDRSEFVRRVAHYYCELNVIHPFRDGNGRAQRIFFDELAITTGYEFNWSIIERTNWLNANIAGFYGDLPPLITLFEDITVLL